MKKNVFFLLIVFVISCKKNNEIRLLQKEIAGTWVFEKRIGYPFDQPTLPAGNGQIIVVGKDGGFERKNYDTLLFRGSYSLQKKKDCYERKNDIVFSTNENTYNNYQYIEVVEGNLTLSTPNCYQDGGTAYYRRLK